jgi:hypothetical protein
MKIRVDEYIRPDGSIPYKEWFDSLDAAIANCAVWRRYQEAAAGGY